MGLSTYPARGNDDSWTVAPDGAPAHKSASLYLDSDGATPQKLTAENGALLLNDEVIGGGEGGAASSLTAGQTTIKAPAVNGHLLLTSTQNDTAGRFHIEPKGHPVGTSGKVDVMFDPYDADGVNYRIVNLYTKSYDPADASTTQGNDGIAVLGLKGIGDHFGIEPALHFGFSDDGPAGAVPMKMYYFDTSDTAWRTPLKGAWRAGLVVSAGDYILASNKMYQTAAGGTTGATKPVHTSGDASDDAVTWTFVRDFAAAAGSFKGCILFGDRDDLPKFGLSGARTQHAKDSVFWNNVKLGFLNSTGLQDWNLYSPTGTDDLRIECNDGTARFFRFDKTGKFVQIGALAELYGNSTPITSGDATPSIAGVNILQAQGSTAITAFTGMLPYQKFWFLGNGAVALTHNASIVLNGAATRTPANGAYVPFMTNGAGTAAKEIGEASGSDAFDNTGTGLTSTTKSGAIAELKALIDAITS